MDIPTTKASASTAPGATLTALLGVKGPLRLLPQGPAPKPHIVLKRDYSRIAAGADATSRGVLRFSFIAGKKFAINKGQQLLFTIAPPADAGGKTPPAVNTTFLLEGDIIDTAGESANEPPLVSGVESAGVERRVSFEGMLPPRMRKSQIHKQACAGFAKGGMESTPTATPAPPPANTPAPRVFVDCEVQTETIPLVISRQTTPIPRTLSCSVQNPEASPTQLPSPVSADHHAREIIPDALDHFERGDADDCARSDRSLSPMDLGSESSTPASTLASLPAMSIDSTGSLLLQSPRRDIAPPPAHLAEDVKSDSAAEAPPSSPNALGAVAAQAPPLLERPSTEAAVHGRTPPAENAAAQVQQTSLAEQDIASSSATVGLGPRITDNAPTSPRAAKPTPRAVSQRGAGGEEGLAHGPSGTPLADAPTPTKDRNAIIARQAAPTFVKSVQASLPTTWEADEWGTSAAPYIPTPSIGNPLGIRPSSSLPPLPKALPKGPRALNAAQTAPKKPVVVGAKWSAARSAGSSATSSSLGGVSASSSSSSIAQASSASSIPTSPAPAAAKPVLKASLSEMLGYTSPSPPPPPTESPPPVPSSLPRGELAASFQKSPTWSSPPEGFSSPPPPNHSYQKSPFWTPPAEPAGLPGSSKDKSTSGWNLPEWATDDEVEAAFLSSLNSRPYGAPVSMGFYAPTPAGALTPNPYCEPASYAFTPAGALTPNPYCEPVSMAYRAPTPTARALTPNPYCESVSTALCASTPAAMSHDLMPTPSARPTAFDSDSAMWTPEASPPLLFQGNNKSRKRAYEEWKNENWSQSMTEHSKKLKTDASASPGSSSSYTARASISAPTSSLVSMVPAPPPDNNACRSPATYVRPYYAKESGSWSTRVIVPIPKVPMTHPLPARPVAGGSSYRPSTKSRRKHKSRSSQPRRSTEWPATMPNAEYRLHSALGGVDASVQKIMFNGDGTQVAFICADRTLRIWDNKPAPAEVARLAHSSPIASACWLEGPAAVMTMCRDGTLSTWTRSAGNDWKYAVLIKVPELPVSDAPFCMAYHKDRIAVSMMSVVKVWLLISGKWQAQREIARSGVTALKFVQDGDALIGGCRDGVLWYCEIPNGTLRVHAFLSQKPIISIDTHPTGTYLLVGQEGGKAHLVTMRPNQNKGNIERTYTSEKIQAMSQKGFPAVFATKGQAVLYGTMNGCALVWDRKKGSIVYGLKHPEGDPVETAATFDGRPGVEGWIITGTKQGRVFWWPVPVAAAPGSAGSGTPDEA